jgi:FGGY-family pentulose kinase/HAD superfamily hydrolase (TIGR01509 family)
MGGAVIGVDVGTRSARAGVFDDEGRLLASAKRPIAMWREAGEIVEHSSADIWGATSAAVREAVTKSGLAPEAIVGLGFDATCSLVVLDRAGAALPVGPSGDPQRNVIAWMDHRAIEEAADIDRGGHDVLRYVGGAISPEMQAPKLLWLARRAPRTFADAAHFLDLSDFLTFRATGALTRSACTVTCKWNYLAHARGWPQDFFDSVGLGALGGAGFERIGAEVAAPGTALGRGLGAEAAQAFGLPPGVPVGAGLIDAHAGAVATMGASLAATGDDPNKRLALILGTSSCCMALAPEARFIAGVWGPSYSALTPGQWLTEGGQSAFGGAIDHLMRMSPAFADCAWRSGGFAALEREIVARAGGLSEAAWLARDLHVSPDFLGNRSPFADPSARGAIVGLDLRDDVDGALALYVAGLCGLAQGLGQVIGSLESGGYRFDTLVASGGASGSALVRQIIADATGKRVAAPETSEPVLLGAAMIGAVAAGRRTIGGAMAAMSRLKSFHDPAGGEIAALHAQKRRAFETLQDAERRMRQTMRAGAGAPGAATSRVASAKPSSGWPEVVIFDCDGVLVDSEPIAMARTRQALGRLGLTLTDDEARDRFLGVSAQSMQGIAERDLGASLPPDFQRELAREILADFERELKGVDGIREALAELGARVCVASSGSIERIRASLRIVGYTRLFEPNVFSAAEVARGKPEPDLLLHAAARMDAEPGDCLVIEDSVPGVTAAIRAGMTVFGFTGAAHATGGAYGERLGAAGAATVFDDMRELPRLIGEERARRRADAPVAGATKGSADGEKQ